MLFIMSIAVMISFLKIRTYALKVQDRVIRLEETLRMQRVLPEPLKDRIGELTVSQMVALRFAPDAELAGTGGESAGQQMGQPDDQTERGELASGSLPGLARG